MMKLATAFLLSAAGVASAGKSVEVPTNDIAASSPLGNRILSAARLLENNNNNNNNFSWISGYSIRFEKCATSDEYYGGYFGNNNKNNNNRQNFNGLYQQRLVHFKLCPTGSCSASASCSNGADYVIDMNEFVDAYIDSKLTTQQYNCETVRENCYCENANDDQACEATCYANAGLDYCEDENNNNNNNNNNGNNGVQFNLQEAVECRELDIDNDALQYYYYSQGVNNNVQQYNYGQQNNNGQQQNQEMKLFVGPYCSANGKSIFIGTFMDEACSYAAPSGTYEKFSYGKALPYSTTSLVETTCISCKEPQENNNNGDQQDEDKILEVCEQLYEASGKCEASLASGTTYYPNTYGCEYIKSLHAPGKTKSANSSSAKASTVFAVLFAASTIALAGLAYHFHQKANRSNVDLSKEDGGALA